MLASRGFKNYC